MDRVITFLILLERRFNHPYWKSYPDDPDTHWGPLSEHICRLADWVSRGACHD